MKRITYLSFLIVVLFNQLSIAQSINNWAVKSTEENSKTRIKIDKKNIPSKYKVLSLDFKALQSNLKSASKRNQNNKLATTLLLDFPNENGSMESYTIEKTSVLAPELEAKYPEIQSFYGVSTKNPLNKIFISTSPQGFTGLITGEKTIYIDPVSKNDTRNYMVYDRKDCSRSTEDSFVCSSVIADIIGKEKTTSHAKTATSTDGNLRTYRLALACSSAYSLYHGNTLQLVLAAMNTTITRVNSVFKRDLSVVFQIVADNEKLIYINGFNNDASPDPDPYDNFSGNQMINENTSNITGLITVGAYDIGHVFSTGGGGVASISPCVATDKGRGVTGIVTPQFDPFDIDYVAHEIGHQFGAGHTYYNACFGSKVDDDYEPGSASTIMGYAGICAPNVQENSDAYFHARSIAQMTTSIAGHTCVAGTSSGNTAPVVAAITARTIPKSTPFILTGSATDPNTADVLTYTWEQYNNDGSFAQPPVSGNLGGPVFRSFMPINSPARTFPNLAAIISNTTPTWEVLPSVGRTLNFRLTVRDNSTLGGRTNAKDVAITVGSAGPFLVSSPNAGNEIWYVGETKTITWDVASTNTTTYSTTVNISLSTDGGNTYPIILATGVANSGSANITVPNNVGKLNRIKVEAAANIFFDISNANFEIKSGKFEMTSTASTQSVCKPTNAVFNINFTAAPAFSEGTTFSAIGAPAGATVVFSPTTRNTSGTFTMTVSNTSGVAAGNYPITIKGTSATANIDFPVLLNVFDNTIGNVTLTSPSNGATNMQTSSLLQWSALSSASSYLVEIATSPTFATITETATVSGTSYQTTLLAQGTINYWRVRPSNSCVSGVFSEVFVFQIASDLCRTYTTTTNFSPNATWELNSNNAVSAKIDIADNINISKVTFNMKATHASVNDIKMQFSGPTGIFAEVYNRDCNIGGVDFDVTFDDAGTALTCGTNPGLGGSQKASQSLSKFNGSSSLGAWTLLATDRGVNSFGGTFNQFSVTICGKLQIVNNIALVNNSSGLIQGATATIAQAKLGATQPTATTAQLIYTLTKLPTNGTLKLNNAAIVVGGTFTQTDINNNLLSYTHNGLNANPDSFKFSINGINLAILGGQTYNITVCGGPVPTVASLPNITGQCAVTVTAPVATSNCYGTITGTTTTAFPITNPGTTVITWNFNDGNGQSVNVNQNVIIESTTWNGTVWSNGTPTSSKVAVIAGNYSVATPITACTLTVNNNAVVSIPAGNNVNLTGALTVSSGSFTLENTANLIQSTNVANSGNIIVKRNSSALFRLDYTMWSSPVSGSQTLGLFSPLTSTNRFFQYNTTSNSYNAIAASSTFSLAKGYLIRMPNTWVAYVASPASTPAVWTGTFTGVPNNGTLTYTMSTAGTGYNAVGNPYPSTLNIDTFITENTNNITGPLYFWRKRNDVVNGTSYSTCTTAGCTLNNSHTYTDTDNISIGQGFIVKATSTTLNYSNTMRNGNNTNQFFKTKELEKSRIWLNLSSNALPVNQMLLAYMTGATLELDPTIDGTYINDSQTALNSLIGNDEFAVQGRPLPFDSTDEVPLSFKTITAGDYSIAIDRVDGLFAGTQEIILKDNETGTETDLKNTSYKFSTQAGTFNTRFSIKYQKTLGTDTPVFDENNVVVFKRDEKITIKSNGYPIQNIKLFDIKGRLLFEKTNVRSNLTSIDSSTFANQVLIVRIASADNKIVNKKVAN